jgi:hypothetical protein
MLLDALLILRDITYDLLGVTITLWRDGRAFRYNLFAAAYCIRSFKKDFHYNPSRSNSSKNRTYFRRSVLNKYWIFASKSSPSLQTLEMDREKGIWVNKSISYTVAPKIINWRLVTGNYQRLII